MPITRIIITPIIIRIIPGHLLEELFEVKINNQGYTQPVKRHIEDKKAANETRYGQCTNFLKHLQTCFE